jgi:hypothetical protein
MAKQEAESALVGSMSKKYKPTVNIGVNVDSYGPPTSNHDWRKEECKRMDAEIAALEKELKDFEPEKAAKKIKDALEIKLKLKKLRREEHDLKLNSGGLDSY